MATNYTTGSNKAPTATNPKFIQEGTIPVHCIFPVNTAFVINDTVLMAVVPIGATMLDCILSSDGAMDSNAASTLSFQIGDQTVANRYITTHLQGNNQAMAPYHMDQGGGSGFVITATTNQIIAKVIAAPATGATGVNLRLTLFYSMDP
jgi:hypothetical protein